MSKDIPEQFDVWRYKKNKDHRMYIYRVYEDKCWCVYFDATSQEFRNATFTFDQLKEHYEFYFKSECNIFKIIFKRRY